MPWAMGTPPYTEADAAVEVAERGLASWREAKAAWLDAFAAFTTQEPPRASPPSAGDGSER